LEILLRSISTCDLKSLLEEDLVVPVTNKELEYGILSMARIRGFILVFDKDVELEKVMRQTETKKGNFLNYLVSNCEKNEGLSKQYSFQVGLAIDN